MSTLLLLRHGQAAFGADRYDTLSDRGREQSILLGSDWAARGRRFDRIWIGPRDRHRDTARGVLEPLGLDWRQPAEPALDEFGEGQQILAAAQQHQGVRLRGEGAITGREAAFHYMREIDAWAEGRSVIEGVPPVGTFRATVEDWLRRATAEAGSGKTVLAVTSGGVIAAALAMALDLPDARLAALMHMTYNAAFTEFAFAPGRALTLVSFNVASHLPEHLLTRV